MSNVNKGCLEALGIVFLFLLNLMVGIALRGYVLMKLWTWFAVPILKAPAISLMGAYGLSLIVSWQVMGLAREREKKEGKSAMSFIAEGTAGLLLGYGVLLLLGYIFSKWV